MKLVKLKIIHFGKFDNLTIDLPNSDLNVFYGPNEAGKSTIVAFIKQVLFGFHLRNNKQAFFEDYMPLASVSPMGGSLFFENDRGQCYELERLYVTNKGSKMGTLTVRCADEIVPATVFFDQFKNIDGDFYTASFIFNQEMLAKVNQLNQKEIMERINYLGAANSDQIIDVRGEFSKTAESLFKKAGNKPPINQLLLQMQKQRQQVSATEAELTTYQDLQQELATKETAEQQLQQQLAELQQQQTQFKQLQNLLPTYQELIDLKRQVKPVAFNEAHYQEAQTLALKMQTLHETQTRLQQQLTQLEQQRPVQAEAAHLWQQKPVVLQWQAENRSYQQAQQQLTAEQQQLLALNPSLVKVAALDQEQMLSLQNDYQTLPVEEQAPAAAINNGRNLLVLGGILFIAGLVILIATKQLVGIILLIAGLGLIIWAKQKQNHEQQILRAAQKVKQQNYQQRAVFVERYGLQPAELDITRLVADWRQLKLVQQKQQTQHQLQEQLQSKLSQLAAAISRIEHSTVEPNFTAVIRALDKLEEQITAARRQEEVRVNLQDNLNHSTQEIHDLKGQQAALLVQAQVQNMVEYKQLQAQKQYQEALQTKINILTTNLAPSLDQLQAVLVKPQTLTTNLATVNEAITKKDAQRQTLQQEIAKLKVKMSNLANSNAVFEAKQALANTETQFSNLSAQYLANLAAAAWLNQVLNLASNERFPKMIKLAQEYLSLLTNNRYNKIEIDKKLIVTRFDGKQIAVEYLSRGTSEQLYFALKLAFLAQIKDQINLPILIDDSFVNFDDQRTKYITQLLKQVAQNNQVLIFTAQPQLAEQLQLRPLTFTRGSENV